MHVRGKCEGQVATMANIRSTQKTTEWPHGENGSVKVKAKREQRDEIKKLGIGQG